MGNMRFKEGDRVRIKSIDWYNENKNKYGEIGVGNGEYNKCMKDYCGKVMTIYRIVDNKWYVMEETYIYEPWTDEMIEGLVEEETKPKFKIGDRVITDTNMKGKIIEVVEEGWYRVDFDDYNGISQSNGVVPEENMTIMTKETNPEPKFKVGDIIISDVFTTNDDKGWKVIDVERTGYKLISVNNSGLICDMDFKNEHYYKLVEEEMPLDKAGQITDFEYEGLAYTLPEGYQFKDENGNIINATKIVLEKKKKEYPKSYEECAVIMGVELWNCLWGEDATEYEEQTEALMDAFIKLKICRDAYWKIAGEEMGLGKPWEPDWENSEERRYSIVNIEGDINLPEKTLTKWILKVTNKILVFSTEEMRDAFYENFKELIKMCKELL